MGVSINEGTQNCFFFVFPPLTLMLCDSGRDNQLGLGWFRGTQKWKVEKGKSPSNGWFRGTPFTKPPYDLSMFYWDFMGYIYGNGVGIVIFHGILTRIVLDIRESHRWVVGLVDGEWWSNCPWMGWNQSGFCPFLRCTQKIGTFVSTSLGPPRYNFCFFKCP